MHHITYHNKQQMASLKDKTWLERYRPTKVEELIVPDDYAAAFNGQPQNYLFAGAPGSGKTTAARALALKWTDRRSILQINCSKNSGIDTVRNTISEFCQHMSLSSSGVKAVLLDEMDFLSTQSQMALRGTIEEFAGIAFFIATCNYPDRIENAIAQSRLKMLSFDFSDDVAEQLMKKCMVRVYNILKENECTIEKEALIKLIQDNYPDFRKILNICYFVFNQGERHITLEHVTKGMSAKFEELYDFIVACKDPREFYKTLSQYKGRETEVINALSTDFANWCYAKLSKNTPGFVARLGDIVIAAHKYGVESKQSIDQFITMLALSFELSKFVQQS